jgi:hypothetical protein
LKSFQAISSANAELNLQQHQQGCSGELQYITDIYTSTSYQQLFKYHEAALIDTLAHTKCNNLIPGMALRKQDIHTCALAAAVIFKMLF